MVGATSIAGPSLVLFFAGILYEGQVLLANAHYFTAVKLMVWRQETHFAIKNAVSTGARAFYCDL